MKNFDDGYEFSMQNPMTCRDTGKFEAPSPNYRHSKLPLDDTFELCVVTSDTLYLKYRAVKYTVPTNNFLLLEPHRDGDNIREGFRASKCDFYWLHIFPPAGYKRKTISDVDYDFCDSVQSIFIPEEGSLIYPERVAIYMRQLHDCIRSASSFTLINYLTSTIFCEIGNQVREQYMLGGKKKKTDSLYNNIEDYIEDHITEKITTQFIAKEFSYNQQYLNKVFKEQNGVSLHEYISKKKIEQANFYLSETDMNIEKISEHLGYSDTHNFMKLYKKITGMTPTTYRKSFPNRLRYNT